MQMTAQGWLARVRHDLVKRMVWPARDRRDLGGPVNAGELVAKLVDDEGQPIGAQALWQALRADAPPRISDGVLHAFAVVVANAEAGARANQLEPVWALEAAFDELARQVKASTSAGARSNES
jgi:hypothetical protein